MTLRTKVTHRVILSLCQIDTPCHISLCQNDTPCQSDTPCRFDDRIILSLCYSDPLQKTLILISLLYALVLRLLLLEKVWTKIHKNSNVISNFGLLNLDLSKFICMKKKEWFSFTIIIYCYIIVHNNTNRVSKRSWFRL